MFQNINKIENTREKKFFIEKVNLFIKLISVFAQRNNLVDYSVNSDVSGETIKRLKELEIFETNLEDEQKQLLKVLKAPLYSEFITAVNYNLKHKKLIGDILNNIDPRKRKIIQEKSKKND